VIGFSGKFLHNSYVLGGAETLVATGLLFAACSSLLAEITRRAHVGHRCNKNTKQTDFLSRLYPLKQPSTGANGHEAKLNDVYWPSHGLSRLKLFPCTGWSAISAILDLL